MKILTLGKLHFLRMIKEKNVLFGMILIPFVIVTLVGLIMNNESGKSFTVCIVNEDKGSVGETFIKDIKAFNIANFKYTKKKEAENLIKKKKYPAAYVIPQNFSEKLLKGELPKLEVIKIPNTNLTYPLDIKIEELLKDKILLAKLKNDKLIKDTNYNLIQNNLITISTNSQSENNNFKDFLIMAIIINFVIFSSNHAASELIELKKEKIIYRSISTPNSNFEIIGGVLLGMFIVQFISYTGIILVQKLLFNISLGGGFLPLLTNLSFVILVSISFGILVSRITSNAGIMSIITNIVGTGTIFLSGTFLPLNMIPEYLREFSKLTPQYWAMKGIQDGTVLPSIFMLALFALVLFTAGSMSLRRFVND